MHNWTDFVERLQFLQEQNQTRLALLLNPQFEQLPLPITRHDDPFFPFSRAVVDTTKDLVCAYVFDLASYMAMGAAGVVALERAIRYARADAPTILHGAFSGQGYSRMADATGFGVDAITIARRQDLTFYLENPPHAAFFADYADIPAEVTTRGGVYYIQQKRMQLHHGTGEVIHMVVTDDDLLTVGKLDDYAEQIRAAVEAQR